MIVEAGPRRYEVVEGWGELPPGWRWGEARAVATDSEDRVHVLAAPDHPYLVFDRDGRLLDSWGEGILDDGHGIHVAGDDVYFTLRRPHLVLKFDRTGRHRLTLGRRGEASDTGYTPENRTVLRPGGPFNFPTEAAVGPDGRIYVSDGYRNCRIHTFAPDGVLLNSWGEPGAGPGQFNLVHGVTYHKGCLYVADRNNNRIQIFTPEGGHLATWAGFLEPCKVVFDADDIAYVAELGARISLLDLAGNVLGRIGDGVRRAEAGGLVDPHGLAVDAAGDIYVGEVSKGLRLQKFARLR